MAELVRLLRESLPEAIGGLATAAVLANLGLLYRRLSHRKKVMPTNFVKPGSFVSPVVPPTPIQPDKKQVILNVSQSIKIL